MNKILLFSITLLITFSAKAQIVNIDTVKSSYIYKRASFKTSRQTEYMYSIGLKLLTIQQLPKIMKQINATEFYNSSLNGAIFKYNDNQISYRLIADFFNKTTSFNNECEDCEIATGKITDYSLTIGFEKNLTYSRIQPYFGADAGFRVNKFKGESHNAGAVSFTSPYDVTTHKNAGVFSPLIGLKLGLIEHLTLSAESSIAILYAYETQDKMYKDASRTRSFQRYNRWEFLLKPLSIVSLQYNLGSIN